MFYGFILTGKNKETTKGRRFETLNNRGFEAEKIIFSTKLKI
jgi:hypothetical protein